MSGAGKLPKAGGDHVTVEVGEGEGGKGDTISCVSNQQSIRRSPRACQSDSSIDSTLVTH